MCPYRAQYGGAIYNEKGTMALYTCVFKLNAAEQVRLSPPRVCAVPLLQATHTPMPATASLSVLAEFVHCLPACTVGRRHLQLCQYNGDAHLHL